MNISDLFKDDDAVSPVIGVILMVAITVILAAVIGAFVLNIGGSQESAPQVTWDWSDNDTASVLNHGGGDKVQNPSQLTVSVSGSGSYAGSLGSDTLASVFSNSISAGDEAKIVGGSSGSTESGTVELIWESSDGSDTQILSTHEYSL